MRLAIDNFPCPSVQHIDLVGSNPFTILPRCVDIRMGSFNYQKGCENI